MEKRRSQAGWGGYWEPDNWTPRPAGIPLLLSVKKREFPGDFCSSLVLIEVQLLYKVVLDSAGQQRESTVCRHLSLGSPSSHPSSPHPGHCGAASWAPWATPWLPTDYLSYTWRCIYVCPMKVLQQRDDRSVTSVKRTLAVSGCEWPADA